MTSVSATIITTVVITLLFKLVYSSIIRNGDSQSGMLPPEMNNSTPEATDLQANSSSISECHLEPLIINLTNVSRMFKLPKTVDIGNCVGTCSDGYTHSNAHFFLKRHGAGSSFKPCCVPFAYKDLTTLIQTSLGLIQITSLPGAIITKCGCVG